MPRATLKPLLTRSDPGTPGFQLRVALLEVEPQVWRRIEVSAAATFWDLHVAINDAMGWNDSHTHEFEVAHPSTREPTRIGIPDPDWEDDGAVLPGWGVPLAEFLRHTGTVFLYRYDFGDGWEHEVLLEAIVPRPPRGGFKSFPRITGGERACPPDDCGGPFGYAELVAALRDPSHAEHRAMKRWAPRGFDPEKFSVSKVRFDDADARLAQLLRSMER